MGMPKDQKRIRDYKRIGDDEADMGIRNIWTDLKQNDDHEVYRRQRRSLLR